MSLAVNHLYEFGEFRLDTREKILTRGGEPLELTPKGFELLSLLVENQGRLLGKDELMDKIWADSFVEEGNLTFNIRQLRKLLGDDAHRPKYIKTVRRHGYRFIAEVTPVSAVEENPAREKTAPTAADCAGPPEPLAANLFHLPDSDVDDADCCPENTCAQAVPAAAPGTSKSRRLFAPVIVAVIVLLAGAAVIGSWYVRSSNFMPNAPILSAPFTSEKLSTNGKVYHAALLPDGKSVVYTHGTFSEKQSVRLRHLDDGGSVEIIPPSDDFYYGLKISPDGKQVYFVRRPRKNGTAPDVYRVPIAGGIPQKIVSGVEGWISLSPDGARVSFVRCPYREDEYCSLWIADAADGKNERKLVTRPRPFRIGDNRIAPDGKSIAFAVGQSATASNEFTLAEIDLASGAESEPTKEKFFNIRNLEWLPDKSGWLVTASRIPNKNSRIWQISARSGEAAPLTNDSEVYSGLSLDRDATRLVSTQFRQDFRLRLLDSADPSRNNFLVDASSVSFAPDGRIYFGSIMSGNDEIWSINADGSSQRQLTNHAADDSIPLVAPDGKAVYFASNRSGEAQIWRMNADGSDQTQITQKEGGAPVFVSPDGEWVYYRHGLTSTLWRVSTAGGGEQLVLDKAKSRFAISPDGTQIAFSEMQNDERVLKIVSLADGQPLRTFRLADKKAQGLKIAWMPDGKNLAYVSVNSDNENNILWMQPLDAAEPRQIAAVGNKEMGDFGFAAAPDGKTFALIEGEWRHDAVLLKGLR